jgi:hypothetical protein
MNIFLIFALVVSTTLWAQDASEEAIILNQELQFLEESASNVTVISSNTRPTQETSRPLETESLERKYFGNDLEDGVSTKVAAPKRRSY